MVFDALAVFAGYRRWPYWAAGLIVLDALAARFGLTYTERIPGWIEHLGSPELNLLMLSDIVAATAITTIEYGGGMLIGYLSSSGTAEAKPAEDHIRAKSDLMDSGGIPKAVEY